MKPMEPTVEDLAELSKLQELEEMYEREEALRLWAEEEEAERSRTSTHEGCGLPAFEPEFDRSEEDDSLPD
jgi:hypothetical protein